MFAYLILHYKNADITEQCIDTLLSHGDDSHIIVVDNASDNGSYERLTSRYDSNENIHFLHNEKNLGYAAGNNVGFRYGKDVLKADWIVLLNNDVTIEQTDFKEVILKEYKNNPFYIAGPDIVTPEGDNQNPFRTECMNAKVIKKNLLHDYVVLGLMKVRIQQLLKKMLHYDGSTFKIETNGNTSYSSTANIHLMPGMSGSTASGNGIVYVSGKVSTNSLVVDGIEINPRGLTAVFG